MRRMEALDTVVQRDARLAATALRERAGDDALVLWAEDIIGRHCSDCNENVYYADTIIDARKIGGKGHCVALDLGVERRDKKGCINDDMIGSFLIFGRPSKEHEEKNRLRDQP